MSNVEKISQEKLQEILLNVYKKGSETENIQVSELIEDIKKEFLSVINISE